MPRSDAATNWLAQPGVPRYGVDVALDRFLSIVALFASRSTIWTWCRMRRCPGKAMSSVVRGGAEHGRYANRETLMLPCIVSPSRAERRLVRYGDDIPQEITTGDIEALALYAGQSAGLITDVAPAGPNRSRHCRGVCARSRPMSFAPGLRRSAAAGRDSEVGRCSGTLSSVWSRHGREHRVADYRCAEGI
jgi:hypothetical protein